MYKAEIERAYRILTPDNAEMQNLTDIKGWYKVGFIDSDTATILYKYNRELYANYVKED